jgi:hypothetical protein
MNTVASVIDGGCGGARKMLLAIRAINFHFPEL